MSFFPCLFFFNDTATTEIYTLSLHDALPIWLKGRLVSAVFEDWKDGRYKILSFYAKRARGRMARYAIENRAEEAEALKNFAEEGYAYAPEVSDPDTLVFRRRED